MRECANHTCTTQFEPIKGGPGNVFCSAICRNSARNPNHCYTLRIAVPMDVARVLFTDAELEGIAVDQYALDLIRDAMWA